MNFIGSPSRSIHIHPRQEEVSLNEDQKWPGIDGDVQIQISQTTFSIDDDGQEEGENQQVQIQINWAINSRLLGYSLIS